MTAAQLAQQTAERLEEDQLDMREFMQQLDTAMEDRRHTATQPTNAADFTATELAYWRRHQRATIGART
jgi:hypothetical protein